MLHAVSVLLTWSGGVISSDFICHNVTHITATVFALILVKQTGRGNIGRIAVWQKERRVMAKPKRLLSTLAHSSRSSIGMGHNRV